MVLCQVCGAENRDKARFCRGCARALAPVSPPQGPAAAQAGVDSAAQGAPGRALVCGACQAVNAPGEAACEACGKVFVAPDERLTLHAGMAGKTGYRWAVIALVVVTALVAGTWWLAPAAPPSVPMASSPLAADKAAEAPRPAPQGRVSLVTTPSNAALRGAKAQDAESGEWVKREAERAERARQTLERLAQRDKVKATKTAEQRRAAAAEQAAAPSPAGQGADHAESPQQPAAGNVQAPRPAATRVSVEQACAASANFLARDFCRIDACRLPGNAQDPICQWYRQLEQERKSRLGG